MWLAVNLFHLCVCVWVPTWLRLCHGMCWRSCGNLDPHNLLQHDPISYYSFTSCLFFLVAFPQKFCHQLHTLCLAPPMLYDWPNTTSFIWVLMNQDITHLKKSQDTLKEEDIRMCRIGHIILLQQAPWVKNTRLFTLYDAHNSDYQSNDADLCMKASHCSSDFFQLASNISHNSCCITYQRHNFSIGPQPLWKKDATKNH